MTAPRFSKKIALLRDNEVPRKNSVGHADSVEKIVAQLSLLSPDPVQYQSAGKTGRLLTPRIYDSPVNEVLITPSLFRKFVCTDGCTACCQKFTLDYIPSELPFVEHSEGFAQREVYVNGKKKVVYSNDQNNNPICDFLRVQRPDGGLGCANYRYAPLSCISAPQLQFIQMRPGKTYVLKKPFGRAWAMTPTPQCRFLELEEIGDFHGEITMMVTILGRFQAWASYLGIRTTLHHVVRELMTHRNKLTYPTNAESVWTSV